MSKKRRGPTYKRSGAWLLFTPRFLSLRRDGSYCQSGVQEAGINDCNQTQPVLQPDSQLASLQAQLASPYSTPQLCALGGHGHQQINQLSHNSLNLQLIVPSAIAEWPLTELSYGLFFLYIKYPYSIISILLLFFCIQLQSYLTTLYIVHYTLSIRIRLRSACACRRPRNRKSSIFPPIQEVNTLNTS